MKVINLIFCLLISFIFISCSKEVTDIDVFFSRIKGHWKNEKHNSFETWYIENGNYVAKSYKLVRKDTLVTEWTHIKQIDGAFYYEAKVTHQNDGKPVLFKLQQINKDSAVFTNPAHDFPTKIKYILLNPNTLKAEISGVIDHKKRQMDFDFKRLKKN